MMRHISRQPTTGPSQKISRRRVLASSAALGVTAVALPAAGAAASVGGSGGGEPNYLGQLARISGPDWLPGKPVGGFWSKRVEEPTGWSVGIMREYWSLPALDDGIMEPPFAYTYEVSINDKHSWHEVTWNPTWSEWGVVIGFDVIPDLLATAPRPDDPRYPYFFTDESNNNYLTQVFFRALDGGTVIDQSASFWLA